MKVIVNLTPTISVKDRVNKIIADGGGETNDLAVVDSLLYEHPELEVEFVRKSVIDGTSPVVLSRETATAIREMSMDILERTP